MLINPYTDYIEQFRKDGFAGPIPLLVEGHAHFLSRHRLALPERLPVWDKSLAAADPFVHGVATDTRLLDILKRLLGEDIVVWGASYIVRKPGEIHPWHTDIESALPSGGFVSAWIGLSGTKRTSSLKFLRGSQAYGISVQEAAVKHGVERLDRTDAAILELARAHDPDAEIVQPETSDGDALLFDGRLWHGSHSKETDEPRVALLLQFARADVAVHIPDYSSLDWPFHYRTDAQPPAVVVSGQAPADVNVLAHPLAPIPMQSRTLQPTAHPIDRNLRCKDGVPFTSTHCFLGRTANVDYLESHYSVLMPGCSPHPPHAHLDEEILVVMHGTAELVVPAAQGNEPEIFPAPAGTAIYYPSYQLHTIRNPSQEPVSYAMLRWRSNAPAAKRGLWPQLLQGSWLRKENIPGPVAMKGIVDGPSVWLGKLHAHITRLQPGAGYGAHRDEHDVVIFLLEGAFELMNARIAAPALVFLPAGCLHDMKALGPGLTKYLVWEFHRTDPEYPAVESHIATAGGAYLSPEAAE